MIMPIYLCVDIYYNLLLRVMPLRVGGSVGGGVATSQIRFRPFNDLSPILSIFCCFLPFSIFNIYLSQRYLYPLLVKYILPLLPFSPMLCYIIIMEYVNTILYILHSILI